MLIRHTAYFPIRFIGYFTQSSQVAAAILADACATVCESESAPPATLTNCLHMWRMGMIRRVVQSSNPRSRRGGETSQCWIKYDAIMGNAKRGGVDGLRKVLIALSTVRRSKGIVGRVREFRRCPILLVV